MPVPRYLTESMIVMNNFESNYDSPFEYVSDSETESDLEILTSASNISERQTISIQSSINIASSSQISAKPVSPISRSLVLSTQLNDTSVSHISNNSDMSKLPYIPKSKPQTKISDVHVLKEVNYYADDEKLQHNDGQSQPISILCTTSDELGIQRDDNYLFIDTDLLYNDTNWWIAKDYLVPIDDDKRIEYEYDISFIDYGVCI